LTTPLPYREWESLHQRLAEIRHTLHRAVRQYAGDLLPEYEERTPVSRTRDWIATQLARLEKLLRNLDADRMAPSWGVIDRAVVTGLGGVACETLAWLSELRADLERADGREGCP